MNERVANAGNQVRQAFTKIKDAWTELEAARKRMLIILAAVIVVAAIVLGVVVNAVSGRYVVLYSGRLSDDDVTAAVAALTEANIPASVNKAGQLEVPANQENAAIGQLAIAGIPNSSLDYSVFAKGSGLTMTDFEKKQYEKYQNETTLQDIIKTYDGVQNAYVNLNKENDSNRVWNASTANNTASVKVTLTPGYTLTAGQVSGIRYLVGDAAGIQPDNVTVIDSSGTVLAASGKGYDMEYASTTEFLQRQGLQEEVEARLYNKVANILSMKYPNADDYRIQPNVVLNWDAMITESMEYLPLDDTNAGVMEHEDLQALLGMDQYATGVVGETDNTDVPIYADLNGDGEPDAIDYTHARDYLVSYIKKQIEKDGATMEDQSIAVQLRGTLTNNETQQWREAISKATNVPVENIAVQGMLDTTAPTQPTDTTDTIFGIPLMYLYIAAAAVVVLIIVLIIVLILRRRAKKKQLALLEAEAAAEQAEAMRIQQEIEERKKMLKDAAIAEQSEDAITEEVRDFARHNPEITANLLRNWLKEGE